MNHLIFFKKYLRNISNGVLIKKIECLHPVTIAKGCLLVVGLSLGSCAKIPIQAVDLSYALKDEGKRMHEMNLALVDYVFNEKTQLVNDFIQKEYSPALIENFKNILPPGTDVKKDLVEIMQAINPKIDERRDSLIHVLREQKIMITQKLNTDYQVYTEAFAAMQNLLTSASKLNRQRECVYENIKTLSNNRINLQGIDNALNQFIKGAGTVGEKALLLSGTIQTFIK